MRFPCLDSDAGQGVVLECLRCCGRGLVRSSTAAETCTKMRLLCAVCLLLAANLPACALDREAFTFTRYDLHISLEPGQQRLGARGTITLRNDSDVPQASVTLQISSSLHWVSIQVGGKPAGFIT